MLHIIQGNRGLLGEWELGKGSGGENPGEISDMIGGGKTKDEILRVLSLPLQERELFPVTVQLVSGRIIRATSMTLGVLYN